MDKILLANRPKLSPGSLKTYMSILTNLEKQTALPLKTPEEVIEYHKEIIDHLKDVPGNVRKTRLSALVVFIENAKGADKVLKTFREQMTSDNTQYKKQIDKQELTERQKEGFIPLSEVMEKYHALEKEVLPLMKKDALDAREFVRVQLYVLLSCLLLIEPRRSLDYTEFKIRNVDETKDNFMKMTKRVPSFVFNQYKTANKHGQQSQDIPPKLYKIVKRWTELNPHDYLLMNTKQSNKITSTQLTQFLHGFFGKPISTSLLRHIYLTDKYKAIPALVEMQETAKAMGHTVEEALRYVKKVPLPKEK
ncbi:hypothetical protein EBT25_06090 [bacterium]|nr:hypothetical protein [bacterium]